MEVEALPEGLFTSVSYPFRWARFRFDTNGRFANTASSLVLWSNFVGFNKANIRIQCDESTLQTPTDKLMEQQW